MEVEVKGKDLPHMPEKGSGREQAQQVVCYRAGCVDLGISFPE